MTQDRAPPFRIAIIGGGIGGLTAALFLHHFCGSDVAIDVYEQAKEFKEIGNGVGLGVNAMKLLHKIGVGQACLDISGSRDGIWLTFRRYDTSDEITTVLAPVGKDGKIVAMARSEFLDVLLTFLDERHAAKLHTSKKCVDINDTGGCTQVTFADGTSVEADIVIGCDGIHSTVRGQFLRDAAVYSGKIAYRGVVPLSLLPDPWPFAAYSVLWIARDKHFLIFPISQDKSLNMVAFVTKREDEIQDLKESWSSTCDRKELESDFADCHDVIQKVISLIPERPSKWRINDRDPASPWTFFGGKVVLLGDAAHPMTPHQGAGAGQAIEDGYVLGRALSEHLATRSTEGGRFDLERWMNLYEQVRLPRAHQIQTTSREAGELYELQAPFLKDRTYDECLPLLAERVQTRMKWIWAEDVEVAYEKARATAM